MHSGSPGGHFSQFLETAMQCILSGNQYFKILPTKSWRQFGPKNFHNNISLLKGLQLMINVTPSYLVIHHRAGTTKGLNVSLLSLLLVWGGWSHTVTTAKLSNHTWLRYLKSVKKKYLSEWGLESDCGDMCTPYQSPLTQTKYSTPKFIKLI